MNSCALLITGVPIGWLAGVFASPAVIYVWMALDRKYGARIERALDWLGRNL